MINSAHDTVLLAEAVDALNVHANGTYFDGTFGRGGHSKLILERLEGTGLLLATDKDPSALEAARNQACFNQPNFQIAHGSFDSMLSLVRERNLEAQVDGILLDLGVSSPQLDEDERGFSFLRDGPLDMRMDPTSGVSAADWIAQVEEAELASVLKKYGEERFAKRIAHAIKAECANGPITRTTQLASIISKANPAWEKHKHPATRSFQAIRIYLNEELQALEHILEQSLEVLADKGRLVVISFHSLEDRIVKNFMRKASRGDEFPRGLPITEDMKSQKLKIVMKPVKPAQAEVSDNNRSRSAIMRVAERIR